MIKPSVSPPGILDYKLVPLHNTTTPHGLACCLLYNVHVVRLAVASNAKI